MKISAEELGYLLAECFNAITPDTDTTDAERWKGQVGKLLETALRRDPDDVLWALQGCEAVPLSDNTEEPVVVYGAPSADDRVWNAIESDRLAQLDDGRYSHEENIEWIPWNTEIDIELIEAGREGVPGDFRDDQEIDHREYDSLDPPSEEIRESLSSDQQEGEEGKEGDDPVPSDERHETRTSSVGFLCNAPGIDRLSLKTIREKRGSWMKSLGYDSAENGGRVELVSVFADGVMNSSWTGYEDLVKPHRKMGCCFEEAMWMERYQDDIPMLQSLPEGIVIDFPGMRPRGTNDEYGIVRMERMKNRRWKVSFVWIAMIDAAKRTDLLSDKVRLAVFVRKPETEMRKK